jgi:hypothetical protein
LHQQGYQQQQGRQQFSSDARNIRNSKDVRNTAKAGMPERTGTTATAGAQQKKCQQLHGQQHSNSADASNNRTPITKGRISATEIQAIAACQQTA